MRRASFVLFGLAAFSLACSGGMSPVPSAPTGVATASPQLATGFGALMTTQTEGASGLPDFAACLTAPGQPSCATPARIRPNAVGSAPGAPANLLATANGGNVTLTWVAPASADPVVSYIIEAGSLPGAANLANFSTGTTATTFSAGGVGTGTYYVRVRANTGLVTGPASNEATLIVGAVGSCNAPGAPTGLTLVTNNGGTVALAWSAASGSPSSYVVEAGSAAGLANLANSNLGLITSFTATGVGPGVYYVRVRAQNACGTGSPSNEVIVTVAASTVPNVGGTWTLTRTGSSSLTLRYSTLTVTLVQSGSRLTGSILPVGGSRATTILDVSVNSVSANGRVQFGSESPYWNDGDAYFNLTVDSTLTRMTGNCFNQFTCTSASAVRIR
jgi:hypothetical protein